MSVLACSSQLERRLALVHTAKNARELDVLVTDLVAASTAGPTTTALVAARHLRILFGSLERTGPWAVPQQLRARVLCGNLELDLREARLVAGVSTLRRGEARRDARRRERADRRWRRRGVLRDCGGRDW